MKIGFTEKILGYSHAPSVRVFLLWANTLPEGGLIAVGIENDSSMGDRALSSSELNQLEQAGRTYCPDARNEETRSRPELKGRAGFHPPDSGSLPSGQGRV